MRLCRRAPRAGAACPDTPASTSWACCTHFGNIILNAIQIFFFYFERCKNKKMSVLTFHLLFKC